MQTPREIWEILEDPDFQPTESLGLEHTLPPIERADEIPDKIQLMIDHKYPVLVEGLLKKENKLVIGGGSKTFKSWNLINLGMGIATGRSWMGRKCRKGRVLYVNFEIPALEFKGRVRRVAHALNVPLPRDFHYWNMRGHLYDLDKLRPLLVRENREYDLIILDPIYKCYGGKDENSAGDVGQILEAVEKITFDTGAAVGFGAHFAKGNAASKQAIDRISGSGVFARDPDSIITFTAHEETDAFTVNAILRNLPPVDPFVVCWKDFTFQAEESLDPEALAEPGKKKKVEVSDILEVLPVGGATKREWVAICQRDKICGKSRAYDLIKEALDLQLIREELDDKLCKN